MEAVSLALCLLLSPNVSNDALVAELGADRWRTRQFAQVRLALRGQSAMPDCERGTRSDDAEIAHRCREIEDRFYRLNVAKWPTIHQLIGVRHLDSWDWFGGRWCQPWDTKDWKYKLADRLSRFFGSPWHASQAWARAMLRSGVKRAEVERLMAVLADGETGGGEWP